MSGRRGRTRSPQIDQGWSAQVAQGLTDAPSSVRTRKSRSGAPRVALVAGQEKQKRQGALHNVNIVGEGEMTRLAPLCAPFKRGHHRHLVRSLRSQQIVGNCVAAEPEA